MKRLLGLVFVFCVLSLSAFAAKNSQNVIFGHAVKAGATQVPAGTYKVSWTGEGANLQVTIAQNGKNLVTLPAKLVPAKNLFVSISTKTENGIEILESIDLRNLNLVFGESSAAGSSSSAQ